ncbi:MAG TPA: protein phosphatase 2C domain-containing protein [Ktedonosporobacter sp.]|nr:protein phosphatase 2C domain-containing protein [Ktedonosporobacter sp.]
MSAFLVLSGLFLALEFVWPPLLTAFASPTPGSTPQPEDVARAGVSVVRLVTTYSIEGPKPSTLQCTGLGVLVGSWPAQPSNPTEFNAWILTDGNLVNTKKLTCTQTILDGKLSSLTILLSNSYSTISKDATLPFEVAQTKIECRDDACATGPALVGFHSTVPLPYIDVAGQGENTTSPASIRLTKSLSSPSSIVSSTLNADPCSLPASAQECLVPEHGLVSGGGSQPEAGESLVTAQGNLAGMHLNSVNLLGLPDIQLFLMAKLPKGSSPNLVRDNWNKGITALYSNDSVTAAKAFQNAAAANPQFQGAQNEAQAATVKSTPTTTAATPTSVASGEFTLPGTNISFSSKVPLWQLGLGFAVVVLLLLLLLIVRMRGNRARQRIRNEEYAEAERKASVDARRIAEMEATQQRWSQPVPAVPTQSAPPPMGARLPLPADSRSGPLALPEIACPQCGAMVPRGSNFCTNCRLQLSPSESGLHLRLPPHITAALPPARSLDEQPTIEMAPGGVSNGTADATTQLNLPYGDAETYKVHQLQGHKLGLLVAARSDPGIKRKFKPNEDSLFAAQGTRNGQVVPQQFGLFVIADGMGGHANGQDASRMAIQTIVDYMLPRLVKNGEAQPPDFKQLLVEGVQQANQAVHQHNMEQRGDSGTTVTAALVVDTTAYVVNVGDSRTYLYRPGKGLAKVTNDHSVVASLVEAGIIKPDDIYTHPKRNQIYRSLGEKPAVEVDSFVVPLQEGDKLLLCSDGLWDMVRDPQIEEVVKSAVPDLALTGEALIKAALDGGGEDNVSVIVVQASETARQSGKSFQLVYKPDSVQMPQL